MATRRYGEADFGNTPTPVYGQIKRGQAPAQNRFQPPSAGVAPDFSGKQMMLSQAQPGSIVNPIMNVASQRWWLFGNTGQQTQTQTQQPNFAQQYNSAVSAMQNKAQRAQFASQYWGPHMATPTLPAPKLGARSYSVPPAPKTSAGATTAGFGAPPIAGTGTPVPPAPMTAGTAPMGAPSLPSFAAPAGQPQPFLPRGTFTPESMKPTMTPAEDIAQASRLKIRTENLTPAEQAIAEMLTRPAGSRAMKRPPK